MSKSSIEWTDTTWNPITGCSKVSSGCANCYAEGIAKRFWGDRPFKEVKFHPERLEQPIKWRKPRKVFVNSMSDLFHPEITDEHLDQIFAVMALTPHHTYQVLTKRPERMLEYLTTKSRHGRILLSRKGNPYIPGGLYPLAPYWPLPNLWLGVSVENQKAADERIPLLLQAPATMRFLSCEPLLEGVDLGMGQICNCCGGTGRHCDPCSYTGWETEPLILDEEFDGIEFLASKPDWVIVGGESGHNARPCDIAWIRSIVQQCPDPEVACFVKQLGSNPVMNVYDWYEWCEQEGFERDEAQLIDWEYSWGQPPLETLCKIPCKNKGNDPLEWPEDLRVRQLPVVEKAS